MTHQAKAVAIGISEADPMGEISYYSSPLHSTHILYLIYTNFKQRAIPLYQILWSTLSFILWYHRFHFYQEIIFFLKYTMTMVLERVY